MKTVLDTLKDNKLNKTLLLVCVCFLVVGIFGFIYAMDYFRQPNFFGFLFIFAFARAILRLVAEYRKLNDQ